MGVPGSGPPDAGLDLVEDEEGTGGRGEVAGGAEVSGRVLTDADLTLDGFDEHGGGRVVDRSGERVDVSVGHMDDAGYAGGEGFAIGGLRCQRERTHRPAVEGTVDSDDDRASPATGTAGHLQGGFVRLGTGVREEHCRTGRQVEDLVDLLGECDLRGRGEEVRDVAEGCCLFGDRLHPRGVAVAERVDGDPGEEIEVLPALGIPHIGALPADELELGCAEDG
ncbi:Uncharacterised protein [Mycobacteroides abscessus subsp. abscessus]|nr:Uncharacterised protein [Mycobacteroides abscessus subsp. abscessus]